MAAHICRMLLKAIVVTTVIHEVIKVSRKKWDYLCDVNVNRTIMQLMLFGLDVLMLLIPIPFDNPPTKYQSSVLKFVTYLSWIKLQLFLTPFPQVS